MIRSDIRTLCRKRLGETSAAFWTDAEINGYINLACTDIADRVRCIKTNGYLNTIKDQSDYVASSTFPNILGVTEAYMLVNGNGALYTATGSDWIKLDPVTRTELDRDYPGWLGTASGVPTSYYYDREEDLLQLYPAPNAENEGNSYLRVYYYKNHIDIPTGVSGDSSSPTIPTSLTPAIVEYVTAWGNETRGWVDKATAYWNKYYTLLHDYEINRMQQKPDDDVQMKVK